MEIGGLPFTEITGIGQKTTSVSKPLCSVILPIWGTAYNQFLPEALKSLSEQTFKDFEVIISDKATDLPTARNLGIKQASGEYILCLDADDTIDPTFLEKTIGKDDIVSTWYKYTQDGNEEMKVPVLHPTLENLKHINYIVCTSLFKKEIWETVEGFDETMKDGLEDWDFWCQALKAGYTITIIPEVLFFYRRHGQTMVDTIGDKRHYEIQKYILSKL